ncbi:MAG: hypothetical protein WBE90_20035, partial [Xanthobacteraceae bacterium]
PLQLGLNQANRVRFRVAFAWNSCGFATLMAMSSFQSLLRYIPEPSIILFLILAMIGMLALMSLTWLGVTR